MGLKNYNKIITMYVYVMHQKHTESIFLCCRFLLIHVNSILVATDESSDAFLVVQFGPKVIS